ncbi:unnamed protein product, partial [Heterobilharzia americana]
CIDYVDVFTTIETVESTSKEAISNQLSQLPEQHQQISRTFSTNLYRPADYRICGDLNDFPQNEFYSVNSVLFLIFHTAPKSVKVKHGQQIGFTGQFTFELKNYVDVFTTIETVESTSKEAISNQLSNLPEQHQQISRTFSTNLYRPADYRICGDLNDFPQNEFYSVNSVLFLIFHTAPKSVKVKHGQQIGFTGQFTFELKSKL